MLKKFIGFNCEKYEYFIQNFFVSSIIKSDDYLFDKVDEYYRETILI